MSDISTREIMQKVAEAIPPECRKNMVIIGSLAAGYHLLRDNAMRVRTKDIDCVLTPYLQAVQAGRDVAETLLSKGWHPRKEGGHGEPGTERTPEELLPAVRLHPPGEIEWFIELLAEPPQNSEPGRKWTRLALSRGHFGLPSFEFLALTTYRPTETEYGIYCARPEMMALANLLEHPSIKQDLMSGLIENRRLKRSNKDLGRVLAMAYLDHENLVKWGAAWKEALQACFPGQWKDLAARVGNGIRQLIDVEFEADLEEALHACRYGLLLSHPPTLQALRIAGQRLLADTVAELENLH